MNSPSPSAGKLTVRELALLGLMGGLMFGCKVAMSSLPNIHLGALLIVLTARLFGRRALYSTAVYVLLEGIVYGFGLWWVSYLYAWPLLTLLAVFFRKNDSALLWACLTAAHGLCFGALCALPYLFTGGPGAALAYWINGIPFDLVHGAGNFVITLVLYHPLMRALQAAVSYNR